MTGENETELERRMRLVRERAAQVDANYPIKPEDEAAYKDGRGNNSVWRDFELPSGVVNPVRPSDPNVSGSEDKND